MKSVVVVDFGVGNLFSVQRALEYVGASVQVTSKPAQVERADRVVLPGVGAFADGMAALQARGLDDALRSFAARGRPLMGICLGMQLLMDESDEFGVHKGLGLVAGRVVSLPKGTGPKVPHVGWNNIEAARPDAFHGTPLEGTASPAFMYFVHSFVASPVDPNHVIATTPFAQGSFCAALRARNVWGTQFHPEKSGPAGLETLRRFVDGEQLVLARTNRSADQIHA